MELGIKGKVALITGGDSGIGRATAKLLADEGVKIALLDKTSEQLKATVEEVQTVGQALAVQADLRNLPEVESARDQIVRHYGAVDILVNCAGITGATGDFMDISDDDWHEAIEGVHPSYAMSNNAYPRMMARAVNLGVLTAH
jgi:3-oxoacyl-[acyl-carrier protein] reductase